MKKIILISSLLAASIVACESEADRNAQQQACIERVESRFHEDEYVPFEKVEHCYR